MAKLFIITGHYGSGKTNFSVNLALEIRRRKPESSVCVCDLDIVNPYFRTADFSGMLAEKGIKLIAPRYANSSLDIPALDFDMRAELDGSDYLIIDVGGDDTGAVALGAYSDIFKEKAPDHQMLYLINKYRCLTSSAEEAAKLMYEIEAASCLKHTAVVNNSNLGCETSAETIEASADFSNDFCTLTSLPLFATMVKRGLNACVPKAFECGVFVRPVWDK